MHKSNLVIFLVELAGTFGLLVAATGSIVYGGMMDGVLSTTSQLQITTKN